MSDHPKRYSEKKNKFSGEPEFELIDWQGADGCLATDRITGQGARIGYMYRDEPENEIDSGWRFLEGTEDEEYMSDPDNVGVYSLGTICRYDRNVIPYLRAPAGSAFVRSDDGGFVPDEDDE